LDFALKTDSFGSNGAPSIAPHTATRTLNELRSEVVSTARKWASDEVSAAIAHQLNEPLTALLLYLHEIRRQGNTAANSEAALQSSQTLAERALLEARRLCDIVEDLAQRSAAPVDAVTAVTRGRDAIYSWANDSKTLSPPPPQNGIQNLTPREHEVLSVIAGGASNKEGGRHLGISTRTFEVHRANIMDKLGARNAADLVRIALS
jgi:DNA-binding CsgD family transcriptional regulator